MKNIYKILYLLLLPILAIGCSDSKDKQTYVESITIGDQTGDTIFMKRYQKLQIKVETKPATTDFKCFTSTPGVFTVTASGEITALDGGVGSLVIVAPKGEEWTKITRPVKVTAYAEEVILAYDLGNILLTDGQTMNVASVFDVLPKSATDKQLRFKSLNPEIVTVDAVTGEITQVARGVAKIVAEAATIDPDAKDPVVSEPITIYAKHERKYLSTTGWLATAINSGWSYVPSNIIDGNIYSMWHCNWGGAGTPPPYWVLIDMKEEREFDRIEFYRNSTDTRGVEFYTSPITTNGLAQDDASFVKFAEMDFADEPNSVRQKNLEFFPEKKYKTRYLKVILPNTNRAGNNSISEIKLFNVE